VDTDAEHNDNNLGRQPSTRNHGHVNGKAGHMAFDTTASTLDPTARPDLDIARSWLLTPATPDQPELIDVALRSDADAVILDLEDGLAPALKQAGRRAVRRFLGSTSAWVRVAQTGTPDWAADMAALAGASGLRGVVLAKCESRNDVAATAGRLGAGVPVVALIESAAGVEDATLIARHPSCVRLAFGSGDFRRDTGMADDPIALAYPRARLVIASRVAGLPGPIDGPTRAADADDLHTDTVHAASMGMTGRLCLRPDHAGVINTVLSPSDSELAHARRLIDHLGDGQHVTDGSDLPNLVRAKALVERAERLGMAVL